MRLLAVLLVVVFSLPTHAQMFTVIVKSGQNVVKMLVEKKADLAIGVIAGTIVTVGDKSLSSYLGERKTPELKLPDQPAPGCVGITDQLVTCAQSMPFAGEQPAGNEDMKKAFAQMQTSVLMKPGLELFKNRSTFNPYPDLSNPGTPPAAPAVDMERLSDLTFWLSIQSSTFAPDFQEYLSRFPTGEFRGLAERRLASLTVPTPPPQNPASPCPVTEAAILEPVRLLFEATNERNVEFYALQWFDDAVYKTYDGRVNLSKDQLLADRARAFSRWRSVRIAMLDWRVSLNTETEAVIRNTYSQDVVYRDGRAVRSQASESYTVACARSGRWRIQENVDYVQ